jgi:hypothetical protein
MFRTLVILSLLSVAARADDKPTVIVVQGAQGAPEFHTDFTKAADLWVQAAKRANAHLIQIGRDGSPDAESSADKQALQKALQDASKDKKSPLWLVLIGHGTFDRVEAKFNLRGPDISDKELVAWLASVSRPTAVINCASSSAPFLNRLSAPNRVVITATRSGHELNYARFGQFIAQSIADPAADLDKDGQTSLLEAFLAASHRTEEFYKKEGRLATEHALLDDNGDGLGISVEWFQGIRATKSAKEGALIDGARAHQWHLVLSQTEQAMAPADRARRDELELKIETLRGRKPSMSESDYYAQLDPLLLELARLYYPVASTRPAAR